eukprot:1585073-Rhodomonas_salina.2
MPLVDAPRNVLPGPLCVPSFLCPILLATKSKSEGLGVPSLGVRVWGLGFGSKGFGVRFWGYDDRDSVKYGSLKWMDG